MHQKALNDKDQIIEAMQLEMAELHLQATQQSHDGDGRLQHLEKDILDTKMLNARLVEENESFQMLLSEKTLKGHFAPEHHEDDTSGLNTLAEELEGAGDDLDAQPDTVKKMEAENRQLRDSNKALTLYIDKIIGRLLSDPGLEHLVLENSLTAGDADMPPPPPPKASGKALPPTPAGVAEDTTQSGMGGFLQRARSVVARGNTPRPSRPDSMLQQVNPTAHENPQTAPSIPINRGHRRARSDQAQQDAANAGAAAVVQQMTRSSTFRSPSSGPLSPGLAPVSPQLSSGSKQTYFPSPSNISQTGTASRVPSNTMQNTGSSRNSVASDGSIQPDRSSVTDASSVQISNAHGVGPAIPGAVMKQNQMRPLRLVNQVKDEEEAQKKANRGSWMGWFNRGAAEQAPQGYQ